MKASEKPEAAMAVTDRLLAIVGGAVRRVVPAQFVDLLRGEANGLASLDSGGKVPTAQMPPYVIAVAGRNGSITLVAADISDSSSVGRAVLTAISQAAGRSALGVVIGADVQGYDADLAALAALSSPGLLTRTGAGTATVSVIAGTTNQIAVANGDGVAGNPTISFPATVDLSGKTVALPASPTIGGVAFSAAVSALVTSVGGATARAQIWGLTYANGTDATNDIDLAAGGCMDDAGTYWIVLPAITKQLDAAWAVGNNQGGRDTGSIADVWWFIWAIARSDTGVTDALFSQSVTSPTMPANYDKKRLVGMFNRVSGVIVPFMTVELAGGGLHFRRKTPIADGSNVSLTTAYTALTLSVPSGLVVKAFGNATANNGTGGQGINIRQPGTSDGVPTLGVTPGATIGAAGTGTWVGGDWEEMTNTSAQIEWAATASVGGNYLFTKGFEWSRR